MSVAPVTGNEQPEAITFRKILTRIGPSFITMSTTFGPASLILAGTAGATYRYKLAWVLPLIFLYRVVFYDLGVRVGINLDTGYLNYASKLYGRTIAAATGLFSFLGSAYYASSNVLGTATAVQLITGGNIVFLGVLAMIAAICMYVFRGIYKRLEKFAEVLVMVMLVSFLGTLLITGMSFGEFLSGLVPGAGLNASALLMAVAIFSTNGGGTGQGHTYWVQFKGYTEADWKMAKIDHMISSVMMIVINGSIMAVGAEVLNPKGLVPKAANQFVNMLQPLAGPAAKWLFALGLFGAAFTSLAGHPMSTGLSLADGFGKLDKGLESPALKKIAITLLIVMGLWGVLPVALGVPFANITWIAPLTQLLGMPLAGVLILLIAARKDLMTKKPLAKWHLATLWLLFLAMLGYSWYKGIQSLAAYLK